MTLIDLGNLRCDEDLIDRETVLECCLDLEMEFPGESERTALLTTWMLNLFARDAEARRGKCLLVARPIKGGRLLKISWRQPIEIAG